MGGLKANDFLSGDEAVWHFHANSDNGRPAKQIPVRVRYHTGSMVAVVFRDQFGGERQKLVRPSQLRKIEGCGETVQTHWGE